MADKISPVRQTASILPKVSLYYDVQDKIIPNGNKIIEVVAKEKAVKDSTSVSESQPVDRVTLISKR